MKRTQFNRSDISPHAQSLFWDKVDIRSPDECWPWVASTFPHGYGKVSVKVRGSWILLRANRVAYTLTHGCVPEGADVCHSCDTPGCCNPLHLWPGTHQENMSDMNAKGRISHGIHHPISALSDEQILDIRSEYIPYSRKHGGAALAKKHGVKPSTVFDVLMGRSWKHV